MPIVDGWPKPQTTFAYLVTYLKGKDRELWLPIIDYWIGRLHLLRSDVEAGKVPREELEEYLGKRRTSRRRRKR
jgi:hypothetical protein